MPSCLYPSFSTRSETPESTSIFTLPCSRMPARWVVRIVSWSRFSTTTLSIPGLGQQVRQHQPGGSAADNSHPGPDHWVSGTTHVVHGILASKMNVISPPGWQSRFGDRLGTVNESASIQWKPGQRQANRSMTSTAAARPSVTSRALSVLDTFDAAHTRRTLTEIAAAAGLPLSTTHRLVAELVAWQRTHPQCRRQVRDRPTDLGSRRAGRGVPRASLGSSAIHAGPGRRPRARTFISRSWTGPTRCTSTGSPASTRSRSSANRRPDCPLHATGVGKVLLANADPEVLRECLERTDQDHPLHRHGTETPAATTAEVRKRGYATTSEEMTLGASSIAAPITDEQGRVVAALGLGHHQPPPRTEPACPRRPAGGPRDQPVDRPRPDCHWVAIGRHGAVAPGRTRREEGRRQSAQRGGSGHICQIRSGRRVRG